MKQYRISFLIPSDKLSTVMGVLENEVDDFSITTEESIGPKESKERRGNPTNPRKGKGLMRDQPATTSIIEALKKGATTRKQLLDAYEAAGYQRAGASPALVRLVAEGSILRIYDNDGYASYMLPNQPKGSNQ